MSKKVYLITGLSLVLIAGLFVVFYRSGNNHSQVSNQPEPVKVEMVKPEEKSQLGLYHGANFEVVARDEHGKVSEYKFLGLTEPQPIPLDLMTDSEKESIGVDLVQKIQVLENILFSQRRYLCQGFRGLTVDGGIASDFVRWSL